MNEQNQIAVLTPRIMTVGGQAMTTSLAVAEHFEKEHKSVTRAIREFIAQLDDPSYTCRHFIQSQHIDVKGRSQPIYKLTEQGFCFVAMGFTGEKAARWKRAYIQTFTDMREALIYQSDSRTVNIYNEYQLMRSKVMTAELQIKALNNMNAALVAENDRCRHEVAGLRTNQYVADQIITDGFTGDAVQTSLIELKGLLSEIVADRVKTEDALKREIELASLSKTRPDYNNYCQWELWGRLLAGMNFCRGNAIFLYGLIQAHAFDAPVQVNSKRVYEGTVLEARAVSMIQVREHIDAEMFPRDMLYQAARRLQKMGFVQIYDQQFLAKKKLVKLYQIRLQNLLACMDVAHKRFGVFGKAASMNLLVTGELSLLSPVMLIDEFMEYKRGHNPHDDTNGSGSQGAIQ